MAYYSIEPKDRILVKSYEFLSFTNNISKNISKNINKWNYLTC